MGDFFRVNQVSAGWFQGIISDKTNSICFDASYITDFPTDLMYAILSALGILSTDYGDKSSFRVEHEPAIGKWNVAVDGECFVISEKIFHHDSDTNEAKITTVKILIDQFLCDFLFEMKRIIHMYGLIGYRLEWGYEFLLSLYLMLEDAYKKNQLVIKGKKAQGSENLGEDYVMTDFMKECDMISTLREE